jgi:hypothetical protein
MTRVYPRSDQIYTLAEISGLYLRDSPFLRGFAAGRHVVIQSSHLTEEELLAVPGAAESQWRYVRETEEWIPIFEFVGPENGIAQFCDMAYAFDWSKEAYDHQGELWVTPKGHPRRQFMEPEGNAGSVTLAQLLAE